MEESYGNAKEEGDTCCLGCKKEVRNNQNGVQCDMCNNWFHAGCEKVGLEEYKILQVSKITKWFCRKCDGRYRTLKQENRSLREEQKAWQEKYKKLEREYERNREENTRQKERVDVMEGKVEGKIGGLEADITNLRQEVRRSGVANGVDSEGIKTLIKEEIIEIREKEKRKENLIVHNMPEECEGQNADKDKIACRFLFNEVGINDDEIIEVIRLGKPAEYNAQNRAKPRPMLVKMKNEKVKWHIIGRAKLLRNSRHETFRRVFITPDLTQREREVDQKLREELQEKRNKGEEGWYIKKGKLCLRENFQ